MTDNLYQAPDANTMAEPTRNDRRPYDHLMGVVLRIPLPAGKGLYWVAFVVCVSALVGCGTPQGRCGIEDLCGPVIAEDPFPKDRCVPPKGVDRGNFGYVRPQWRVLEAPDAICCGHTERVDLTEYLEAEPELAPPIETLPGDWGPPNSGFGADPPGGTEPLMPPTSRRPLPTGDSAVRPVSDIASGEGPGSPVRVRFPSGEIASGPDEDDYWRAP